MLGYLLALYKALKRRLFGDPEEAVEFATVRKTSPLPLQAKGHYYQYHKKCV
jgi:hypothetical protein